MPERRTTWRTLTLWEKAVRIYLAGQGLVVIGGVVFFTSGYGWETPERKFAAVSARIDANSLRLDATNARMGRVESTQAETAALVAGLARLACKADRDRGAYDGYTVLALPCSQLLGNQLPRP